MIILNKKSVAIIFLLLKGIFIFSNDLTDESYSAGVYDGYISLKNGYATYRTLFNDLEGKNIEGSFTLEYIDEIPVLTINSNPMIEMVFLYNDYFVYTTLSNFFGEELLANRNSFRKIISTGAVRHGLEFINNSYEVKASSFLIEGDIVYSPDNMKHSAISGPWVENAEGSGVGEKIILTFKEKGSKDNFTNFAVNGIIISNGFVSAEKPYLFKKNNRVKQMKLSSLNPKFELLVDLEDTPNLQIVSLPEYCDEIEIEIIDIYKGTSWDDTCINLILGIKGLNKE